MLNKEIEIVQMICLHVTRPKCGRKELSCVDFSLFLCVVV